MGRVAPRGAGYRTAAAAPGSSPPSGRVPPPTGGSRRVQTPRAGQPVNREQYHALLAKAMLEAELDRQVAERCDHYGLWTYHTYDSRRSKEGLPDRIIVGPRGVLWRELKRQSNYPTAAQRDVIARLEAAGQDAAVWKPLDLFNGRIDLELRAIARRS